MRDNLMITQNFRDLRSPKSIEPKLKSEGWCQREDLNLRPKAYESSALPLSYAGHRKRSYILRTFRALSNPNRKPEMVVAKCDKKEGLGFTQAPPENLTAID